MCIRDSPFPANVGSYNDIIASVSGYNSAVYAGTNTAASTSGTYMLMHLFNTKLNNFNNFFNDFNVSKKWDSVKAVSYTHLDVYKRQG